MRSQIRERSRMFKFTLLLVASILSAVTAHADNFAPSDLLYRGEPVTMCYTVVPPICITNGIVWKPRNWNPAIIPLGLEQFDATFEGFISQGGPPAPFSFDGTITFDIPGHTSDSQAGVFPFTVTQFDFTDGGALRIRESPT